MSDYFFYKSIRKTIVQFLDIFNNINIERYDVNGVVKGRYKVPVRFGPKSKAYLWIKDLARDEEILPIMSVVMTGIDFDVTRLTNKLQKIPLNTAGTFAKNATPYNIGFTVTLWALNVVDVDQVLEQVLPYFIPHIFIKIKIPEIDIVFDAKVISNGCSSVMTDDLGEEESRVVKWDLTFTVQTLLFKPIETKTLISGVSGDVAGFRWTSGMGTSGFGNEGMTGKIVNRYYMDETAFQESDNNDNVEIYNDTSVSEVYAFRPVEIDEDSKLLIDYETWGESL